LEVWDVLTRAGPLHRCRRLPEYPRLLVEALASLRDGARRAGGEVVHASFWALVVAGGGLLEPGVRAALEAGIAGPLHFFPDPVFAATAGGRVVLRRLGRDGLIADVGQTAIKVIHGGERALHPRDWRALPPADEVPPNQCASQRLALRAFVASALRRHQRPEAVVLGLPCDFPSGAPGACSYAGLEGDGDFVAEVLAGAGLAGLPCVYLNDAVLAALSARELFGSKLAGPTLVVTLGFGVGVAFLEGGGDGL
jgi:hypothetical protein